MAKIICIEDEKEIRADIAEELRDAGHEVLEAENGNIGLALIKQSAPDLVLSDITMPVMDGHELLRRVRDEHPELSEMPFIFLTALADRDHVISGKKLGVDDYLTKPIDFEVMLATVDARLDQIKRIEKRQDAKLVKLYRAMETNAQAPATTGDGEADDIDDSTPAVAKKLMSVVAVGTDKEFLEELGHTLMSHGHRFVSMLSGRKLVEQMGQFSADVILIGYQTGDLGGIEIARQFRDAGNATPLVVLIQPDRVEDAKSEDLSLFKRRIELPCTLPRIVKNIFAASE